MPGQYALPPACREPKFLQYLDVVKFGQQLESVYRYFPTSRVLVINFEKYKYQTSAVYSEVLDFLGLSHDGRKDFEKINQRKESKSQLMAKLTHRPPRQLVKLVGSLKNVLGVKKLGVMKLLIRLNNRSVKPEQIDKELRSSILASLSSDIEKLKKRCGIDLLEKKEA